MNSLLKTDGNVIPGEFLPVQQSLCKTVSHAATELEHGCLFL